MCWLPKVSVSVVPPTLASINAHEAPSAGVPTSATPCSLSQESEVNHVVPASHFIWNPLDLGEILREIPSLSYSVLAWCAQYLCICCTPVPPHYINLSIFSTRYVLELLSITVAPSAARPSALS